MPAGKYKGGFRQIPGKTDFCRSPVKIITVCADSVKTEKFSFFFLDTAENRAIVLL